MHEVIIPLFMFSFSETADAENAASHVIQYVCVQ